MTCADRRGFTLLELMAALSLMGFAMIGGILLLDQLNDSTRRITQESGRAATEGNGERLLGRLLLDAVAGTDSTKKLRGNEHSVELWTNCDVPGGWQEPCRARLSIDLRGDSSVVVAELSTGETYPLLRQSGSAVFRYFHPSRSDTVWVREWSSNLTLPAAVGVITPTDTVIYPLGAARE